MSGRKTFQGELPDWITLESETSDKVIITAIPRNSSGLPGRKYVLEISGFYSLQVRETEGATQLLPPFCPERHVNGDGSFCLGLTRFSDDPEGAAALWPQLRAYLLCQDYAARHGTWPAGRWLSHGREAADWQIAAEKAADEAGLAERYSNALEYRVGCLSKELIFVDASLLRKPISARKGAIVSLINSEIARREAEAAFTVDVYDLGTRCCGTMKVCPLRDHEHSIARSSDRCV